jgi:molybdate transport system substrate-binding protein
VIKSLILFLAFLILGASGIEAASAAEIKVLSAGAYGQVLAALQPAFEQATKDKLTTDQDPVGQLAKRIEAGESFDVAIMTPAALNALEKKAKIAPGSRTLLARVGIGVVVKAGAPRPNISTLAAFKRAVLSAKSIAYIDPAYGGSSGIYIARLLARLGIADQVKSKTKLKRGGTVADWVASGEVELGIQQISEILPVKGVTFVGPLPAKIQNYTVYAAGVGSASKEPQAAKALIEALSGTQAAGVLRSKGMEPIP